MSKGFCEKYSDVVWRLQRIELIDSDGKWREGDKGGVKLQEREERIRKTRIRKIGNSLVLSLDIS